MPGPFKMKGSPMARNFGAPFRDDKKKMTAEEKQAASLAAAMADDSKDIEVSGGKKTKQGSFIQYPGTAKKGGGATVTGSSVKHSKLRVKEKKGTLTSSERIELQKLAALTEKAYKRDILK